MYKIEQKDYGYKLTFADLINKDEMTKWVNDSKNALLNAPSNFGIFVDMRTLQPLSAEAVEIMQEGQKLFKTKGMARSVVILNNPTVTFQFKKIAKQSGIYQWERYIDASSVNNWEDVAINWIKNNVDPD